MFRHKAITITILAAAALAATVWVCRAAPIVSRPVVSDEILSLTGLDTFGVEVGPPGLWWGLTVGLGTCAIALVFRVRKALAGSMRRVE